MDSIRRLRERAGMSQAQLAEKIGVDRSAVAKWESAGVFPRADKIPALATALGCTVNDLYRTDTENTA